MSKNLSHIGNILQNVMRTCRNDSDLDMTRIWDMWDSAIGKEISQNAQPAAFKGQLLMVHVTSSTWAQQLQFLKKDIIDKVNHSLGKELIKDIRFKIGPM
jgi:predicted nucleic acid-binding Zn ribbon protein